MSSYLISHIDGAITTVLGIFFTFHFHRNREKFRSSPNRLVQMMPGLAPVLIVFGLIQMLLPVRSGDSWRQMTTADGAASAEFPAPVTPEESNDAMGTVSVKRTVIRCSAPGRDIDFRLSYSEIQPEYASVPLEDRLAGFRNFLQQQGVSIVSWDSQPIGGVPCYRIVTTMQTGKIHQIMRVAMTHKGIYRVIATSSPGFHDDPSIHRFLDSFRITSE